MSLEHERLHPGINATLVPQLTNQMRLRGARAGSGIVDSGPVASEVGMTPRYCWEDFHPGWTYESASHTLGADEIKAFAREYDPQGYHVDEARAARTPFGGLIASGWQTCSIAMRLMCDGYLLESSCIGSPGLEELRWLKPVRPGDALRLRSTVLEQTPSQRQAHRGTVRFRWDVLNQSGDVVCSMVGRQHYVRRHPA
jgi:acyl dehydratase